MPSRRSPARARPATRAIGRAERPPRDAVSVDLAEGVPIHRERYPRDDGRGRKFGAINLAQGMPDFPAPAEIKQAACRAIEDDINQYAITWGAKNLREAIAEHAALAPRPQRRP